MTAKLITATATSALVVGLALAGTFSASPANAQEPRTAGISAQAADAQQLKAPEISTLLLPLGSGPVLVVGQAQPGATVTVTYRGESTVVVAKSAGSDLAGSWSVELPGGDFGGGERSIFATQTTGGVQSASTEYVYSGFVFPF